MAIKRYDSSNIDTKTGKAKVTAKPVARPAATVAQKMAAPKPGAGKVTPTQMKPIKVSVAPKPMSKTGGAAIRENLTSLGKRSKNAGI